jgi:Fe-S cluster assembly protein SufD
VILAGPGADCRLDGVYQVCEGEHVDHHTFIDHREIGCTSREAYRGLLDGHATAVFDGVIAVRPGAQHTSAHQENRNLLLSDDATVHTKPHLEIEADDVSCSHGATVGAIDEEQLYYLRSRGIGHAQARAVLTYAFVKPQLDAIRHEPTRQRLVEALLSRLPHGEAARELTS